MFQSAIAADLEAFLLFQRRRGYRYVRAEYILRCFDRFVESSMREQGKRFRLVQSPLGWLASRSPRQAVSTAQELSVIRKFWEHMRGREPRRYARDILWPRLPAKSTFTPYIISPLQIRALLRLIKTENSGYERTLLRVIFLVLYCTGLRFGEVVRLRLLDVDLNRRVFFISESKGRSRWVPFHRSLGKELVAFCRKRPDQAQRGSPAASLFFLRTDGLALSVRWMSDALRNLLRQAGFKPARGRKGPRPYDTRHAFAVHRLTRWYRQGVDLHTRLTWLSAYMGHKNLYGTEAYLNATPELLALAAHRFRSRFQSRSRIQ
jgi:site-specific recombinase XerD